MEEEKGVLQNNRKYTAFFGCSLGRGISWDEALRSGLTPKALLLLIQTWAGGLQVLPPTEDASGDSRRTCR